MMGASETETTGATEREKRVGGQEREGERESLEPRCGTKDETLKISAQKSPRHGATGLMAVRHAKSFGEAIPAAHSLCELAFNSGRAGSWSAAFTFDRRPM